MKYALAVVMLVLFGTFGLRAQQNGGISGYVKDSSGAVIAKAKVKVVNTTTGISQTADSNPDGTYAFSSLVPGVYTILCTAAGFKTLSISEVKLDTDASARVDLALQVGSSQETVTITGENTALMQTESAVVGTVVEQKFIANMPLNGRSFQSLINLTPSVVVTSTASTSSVQQFSINGQRPDYNNMMIDGVSANVGVSAGGATAPAAAGSGQQTSAAGGYNNLVSIDAMQEFAIETSTYSPEYGRSPGGQIIITTRSGTNKWHGDAFEYLRNTDFDANNWFNNNTVIQATSTVPAHTLPRPPERQNDFGGVVGGPVLKNRLFFFYSFEEQKLALPATTTNELVPSVAARNGTLPGGLAVAAVQPYLKAYPVPTNACPAGTAAASDPELGCFSASFSNKAFLRAQSLRMDWQATKKMSFFARGNDAPSNVAQISGAVLATTIGNTRTLTLGQTWLLTQTWTNDIRFNYSYVTGFGYVNTIPLGGVVPLTTAQLELPAPYTATTGLFIFNAFNIGAVEVGNNVLNKSSQYDWFDTVSKVHGPHQIKFGADFRRTLPVGQRRLYEGEYNYNQTDTQWENNQLFSYLEQHNVAKQYYWNTLGIFAVDTWKMTPRLTLTYGLRWDIDPPPGSTSYTFPWAFDQVTNPTLTNVLPNGAKSYKTEYAAFAPRIGVAYQQSKDPRFGRVIRGGFGLFFDDAGDAGGFLESVYSIISSTYTATGVNLGISLPLPTTPSCPTCASTAVLPFVVTAPYTFAQGLSPNLRLPYVYEASLAVEQALGSQQTLTVTYVGAWARNQLRLAMYPPANVNLPSGFYATDNKGGPASYNSLQTLFQRRLSHGLSAMASWVWSHSIDDGSYIRNDPYFIPSSVFKGSSDYDIRHSFQTGVHYDFPKPGANTIVNTIAGHWGTDFIFRARTAIPVDLTESTYLLVNGSASVPCFVFGSSVTPGNPNGTTGSTCASGTLWSPSFGGPAVRPNVNPGVPQEIPCATCGGGKEINIAAFIKGQTQASGEGTLGRNTLRGFGFNELDATLKRDFPLAFHESLKLQFRVDAFNLLNHPAFAFSANNLNVSNAFFGVSNTTLNNNLGGSSLGTGGYNSLYQVGGPRSLQLSLKVVF